MTEPAPSGATSSPSDSARRRRPVALTALLALLLSLVPFAALSAIGASPAGAGPTCPCSLWSLADTPLLVDVDDGAAVELGVQFSSTTSGYISGLRYYKSSANTGEHIGSLWTADGSLLARATFTSESDTGWQQVSFATPVAITANTTYVASYHTNTGHYSVDSAYFNSQSHTNGPLTAPGGDTGTPNGVFAYSPTPTFPTATFNGNNYWVDVVFTSQSTPVSISVSAVQGSMPKGTSQPLTAIETFSDGSTRNVTGTASWASTNPAVGSVSPAGVFSAVGTGSTNVTATIDGITGQTGITVVASIAYLTVSPAFSVLGPNQTKQLTATARLVDGSQLSVTRLVRWGTAFAYGASISPTGLVTTSNARFGASVFTASLGRATGYASVLIIPSSFW